jgi:RNA polymerase sigma-70 factor (ECF subfamily)
LACACSLGDPQAIAVFERLYFDDVDDIAARLNRRGARSDELKQHLRDRLFVGSASRPAKITTYSGGGELRHWFRIVSMRSVLNLTRRRGPSSFDEHAMLLLPDLADDPELAFMKSLYRGEFKAAVSEAFATLADREQNLLKYLVVDGLTPFAVASLYGVHRTTVTRWLADAQQSLLGAIRASMMRRMSVSRTELESILRLIGSRIEIRLVECVQASRSAQDAAASSERVPPLPSSFCGPSAGAIDSR